MNKILEDYKKAVNDLDETIKQIKIDTERNRLISEKLNKIPLEQRTSYKIDKFLETIDAQANSNRQQLQLAKDMIKCRKEVVDKIENNVELADFLELVLKGFGFKEEDE